MASAQKPAELKKWLNAARGGAVNFGLCLGRRPEDLILLLDKSKSARALATQAKAIGETTKTFFGDLEVDGNRARFRADSDPPGGTIPALRKFFEANKLGFKVEFTTDIADDVRDGVDTGRVRDMDLTPELKAWRKADAAVEAKVRGLMDAKVPVPPKALALWKELRKRAARGEERQSTGRLAQVMKLLDEAAPKPEAPEEKAAPEPKAAPPEAPKKEEKPEAKKEAKRDVAPQPNKDAPVNEAPKEPAPKERAPKKAPPKNKTLALVRQMASRLKGKMTPLQEKYLKAAATHARRGADDKAAALLRAVQKAA
ncbi:MAG: hypothetical protein AAF761_05760 [Pseudomonadota bacterium]